MKSPENFDPNFLRGEDLEGGPEQRRISDEVRQTGDLMEEAAKAIDELNPEISAGPERDKARAKIELALEALAWLAGGVVFSTADQWADPQTAHHIREAMAAVNGISVSLMIGSASKLWSACKKLKGTG